jgi:hypothetical protein
MSRAVVPVALALALIAPATVAGQNTASGESSLGPNGAAGVGSAAPPSAPVAPRPAAPRPAVPAWTPPPPSSPVPVVPFPTAAAPGDRVPRGTVRERVLADRGCLAVLPKLQRRAILLRAGVGSHRMRSRKAVGRTLFLSQRQVGLLEGRALAGLGTARRTGRCVALDDPRVEAGIADALVVLGATGAGAAKPPASTASQPAATKTASRAASTERDAVPAGPGNIATIGPAGDSGLGLFLILAGALIALLAGRQLYIFLRRRRLGTWQGYSDENVYPVRDDPR